MASVAPNCGKGVGGRRPNLGGRVGQQRAAPGARPRDSRSTASSRSRSTRLPPWAVARSAASCRPRSADVGAGDPPSAWPLPDSALASSWSGPRSAAKLAEDGQGHRLEDERILVVACCQPVLVGIQTGLAALLGRCRQHHHGSRPMVARLLRPVLPRPLAGPLSRARPPGPHTRDSRPPPLRSVAPGPASQRRAAARPTSLTTRSGTKKDWVYARESPPLSLCTSLAARG